jgi:hypothetical protein
MRLRIEEGQIVNSDEFSKYILENVPIEEWPKHRNMIMAGCNLQLAIKFIERFSKSVLLLSEMAAYSISCRNGELLEELIVLGLDVNRAIAEQDYGYISCNRGDKELNIIELNIIDYEGEDWLVSLLELAIKCNRNNAIRILLRNGANANNFWHYSILRFEPFKPTLLAISTNRRAARTLLCIKKHRKIYPHIDRFIFREIAISIWSSRDTI